MNNHSRRFDAGFTRLVKKHLERHGYRVLVSHKPIPEPRGPERPVVDTFGEDPRYDYQYETMDRLVELKGMIAQVATGGGKSRIFKLCAQRLNMPTLFLTTRKSLMYQMAEGFAATIKDRRIGILGDGIWRPEPNGVNFAIVDTLVARLEVKTVKEEMDKAISAHLDMIDRELEKVLKAKNLPTNIAVVRNPPEELVQEVARLRKAVERRFPIDEGVKRQVEEKVRAHEARRRETIDLLKGIGFITIEEAHEVSAQGFYDIVQNCNAAWYRLALTATPFMRDDEEANRRLMAVTGPIGIKVSEQLLIERGILARPYFRFKATERPKGLARGTAYQRAYKLGIVDHEWRNKDIVKEAWLAAQYGLPGMVLVQQAAHGKKLEQMMRAAGLNAKFIFGQHEQAERKHYLDKLGRGELDVLIGSTILDVGVDVPSVGLVILAGGGKAEVATRQRIGRGLRAKKAMPNVAFIVDYQDEHNNHLRAHALERQRIVESTPGFAEGIVNSFDYEAHGFVRKAA